MNRHEQIVSLIQTLGTSLRVRPEEADCRLNALTETEKAQLLELLKRVYGGKAAADAPDHGENIVINEPSAGKDAVPAVPMSSTKELPDPNTYDTVSDRSAICRGCPSGCELRWDDNGNYTGYSCIVGQETAALLAEYYRVN